MKYIILSLFSFFIGLNAILDEKYTIKNNDTCYDIINKYKIYSKTFYEINNNINCTNLKIGEEINIITNKTII